MSSFSWRSRRAAAVVRRNSGADRPLVSRLCLGLRLGRSGQRVRKPSPGVRGPQHEAISRSPCQRRPPAAAPGPRRERSGVHPGGENRCPCTFAGVTWASKTETVAPEGVYLGKICYKTSAMSDAQCAVVLDIRFSTSTPATMRAMPSIAHPSGISW